MFKKIKIFIKELNLTQQLIGIILTITMVLLVMSFFMLQTYLDGFVNKEMINLINRSQNQIIYRYQKQEDLQTEIFDYKDPLVTHILIDKKENKQFFSKENMLGQQEVVEILQNAKKQSQPQQSYKLNHKDLKQLYVIRQINDQYSLATVISSEYQSNFNEILLQTVLLIVLITIIIVFVIFLVWISTIIQPLNQIVKYLSMIKKKEKDKNPIKLDLDRQDEIGDVSRSIVNMEKEIQRQEKVKMEMIHNISHDLKTPITTIKTYSESIKDGIYPYDTLEKSVDVILENADRLERKAHSLLLLNQIDSQENLPVILNPVRIKIILAKVILSMKVVRPEVEVLTEVDDIIFQGDEESWRICFENLLENAFRYAKTKIEIKVSHQGVRVYNDGEKMSPDRIDKLFKPYEKGTNGQFGLGLSIVHRLCSRMGYQIKGYNHLDGVEFSIEPIPKEPEPNKANRHLLNRHKK